MTATPEATALLLDLAATLQRIEAKVDALTPTRSTSAPPASNGSASGATFPNYGKAKGAPIFGASSGDLDYYAAGCLKSLADPAKSRWHSKERTLLAAIETEIARQGGTAPAPSGGGGAPDFGGADDDIPFMVDDTFREALR